MRKLILGFFVVIVILGIGCYRFGESFDEAYNDKFLSPFISYLSAKDFFQKNAQLTCHAVFPKDEEIYDVKQCAEQTTLLYHPYLKSFFSLFSVGFEAISVHQALNENPDFAQYLYAYLKQHENRPLLLIIIKRPKTYEGLAGIQIIWP